MEISYSGVNTAAFCASTTLAVGTTAAVFAAATATSTAAAVAFGFLATGLAGVAGASVTAWFVSKNVDEYFDKFKNHAAIGTVAMYQFVAHTLFQAIVQGVAQGLATLVSDKISGRTRYA